MKELDFEKVNPELAEVVLGVAEECDSTYCDRMVIKMPPIKLKLIVDGHEIEISNEEELEREEKERNTLKDKIRSFIKKALKMSDHFKGFSNLNNIFLFQIYPLILADYQFYLELA